MLKCIRQKKFPGYSGNFFILNLLRTTPPIAPAAIEIAIITILYIFRENPVPVKLDNKYTINIYISPINPPFIIPFFLI